MSTLTTMTPAAPADLEDSVRRSSLVDLLRHSAVLAKRSLIKTWRTPEALIDVTLQPVIFLTLFTYILGGAIAGGSQHDYLQFLLPGILGQSIAVAGISLGVNMNGDIEKGMFDRFRSLPIARSAPLVGAVMADIMRYLILVVVFITTGAFMGFRPGTDWLHEVAALALAIAFALCFCWMSLWVGLTMRTAGAVQGVMFLLVLPMSFGSNMLVDPSTMPGWLQAFVKVNPMTHLIGAVRGLMVGGPVGTHLMWTLVWMAGLVAVFVPLALRAYNKRT